MKHEMYMRRALQLAALGEGFTRSNPMVGAVIVAPDGRIIGEGWHRRYGQGHAEVNAVASVAPADEHLLPSSTMYVTLEPCSHWGKTPPCARLIIDRGIGRVVVGASDPFREVAGRGVAMLREAGVEVIEGVLAHESERLNAKFMTAHRMKRPFVTLKWARSADGWMDHARRPGTPAARISSPQGAMAVHRLRACHDAIMVGAGTMVADRPRLTNRLWRAAAHDMQPTPVVLDPHGVAADEIKALGREAIVIDSHMPVDEMLGMLYSRGITSVLVEGGAQVLASMLQAGVWDVAREEISPETFGSEGRVKAPVMTAPVAASYAVGAGRVKLYSQNELADVKNL